ncbi:MAG TPA: hypothetical protein VGT24_13180 [Candidatus Acidoferrales bacterium]|nr:hypothetical protein [Candidatus Acidoferrales bacterium]
MIFFARFRKPQLDADATLEARRDAQIAADMSAHGETTTPEIVLPASVEPVNIQPHVEEPAAPEVTDDSEIEKEKAFYLNHPLEFGNQVLGFELQPEHDILLDAILDGRFLDVLILWPRASGKTSCIAVAVVLSLLRNPNLRVTYHTADIDLAERRLRQIADCFDKPTEKFQRLFPELCGLERRVAQEFFVKGRSNPAIIDPSFTVSTIVAANTGSRADLMILDDIVSEANVISENSRDNNFTRYQLIRGLRSGSARMIVSGTVFHPKDTYARIRQAVEAEGENTLWRVDVRSVWRYRCANCHHKDVFHNEENQSCRMCEREGYRCPHFAPGEKCVLIDAHRTKSGEVFGFTLEGLLRERGESRMGLANFTRQLEMNADPAATTEWPRFTPEFLKEHTLGTALHIGAMFIVADLGLKNPNPLATLSDPDASVLVAVAMYGNQAIPIDCVVGQWSAGDLATVIFVFLQKHRFVPFFCEDIGAWPAIKVNVQHLAGTIKLDLRDLPVSNEPNAKLIRGSQLHAAIAAGKIALYYAMPYFGLLREQLKAYPKEFRGPNDLRSHNDLADCMGFVVPAREYLPRAVDQFGAVPSGRPTDTEPSAAGDPIGYSRWLREREERGDIDESAGGLCM